MKKVRMKEGKWLVKLREEDIKQLMEKTSTGEVGDNSIQNLTTNPYDDVYT